MSSKSILKIIKQINKFKHKISLDLKFLCLMRKFKKKIEKLRNVCSIKRGATSIKGWGQGFSILSGGKGEWSKVYFLYFSWLWNCFCYPKGFSKCILMIINHG